MSASFLGKYRPWNFCDFFHSSLSLTRATHISGLSFCSFVGLVRSFLPAIYCLFEEKTHHIFNSRKISHIWITSLIQGLQECQGDVHAWCIKSMPLDDVDQLHSFLNKDNLPPVSCLASYNSDIDTICFFMNDDDGNLMTISVCHISQEERHGPWRMELWSW